MDLGGSAETAVLSAPPSPGPLSLGLVGHLVAIVTATPRPIASTDSGVFCMRLERTVMSASSTSKPIAVRRAVFVAGGIRRGMQPSQMSSPVGEGLHVDDALSCNAAAHRAIFLAQDSKGADGNGVEN